MSAQFQNSLRVTFRPETEGVWKSFRIHAGKGVNASGRTTKFRIKTGESARIVVSRRNTLDVDMHVPVHA